MADTVLFELKKKMDALGGFGTLTVGNMPGTPDAIGTLYEYGGQTPERGFGIAGIKYEKPSVQIVFRGVAFDYKGPRDKADRAFQLLAGVLPGALGGGVTTEYLRIDPVQSPFPTEPPDGNNRVKIGVNFYVTKVPSI